MSPNLTLEFLKLKKMRIQTPTKRFLGALASAQEKEKQQEATIDQALVVIELMIDEIRDLKTKLE